MISARRERFVHLLVLGVVLATAVGTAVAGPVQVSDQPEADNSITRIEVHPDGNATWTIQVRTRLETDDDQTAFERFQEQFRENRSRYLDPFRDNIRTVVGASANETGREMRATHFSAETDIQVVPRRWGIVSYEFTWSNYAVDGSDGLVVGDVFESGFFIAENDSLQLVAPEGYRFQSVDPSPDSLEDGTATWTGRHDFADDRPRATFEPVPEETTAEHPDETTADSPSESQTESFTETARNRAGTPVEGYSEGSVPDWILALLAGLAVAIGAVAVRRQWSPVGRGSVYRGRVEDESDPGEGAHAAGEYTGATANFPSDEEQVLAVLENNGGEMKQADLVDAVDWSKSKVSRILSEMEEEDQVAKLRIGRENLVRQVDDQPQND